MPLKHEKTLIESTHADVYQGFFAAHDLVISLPHIIRFGNELGRGGSPLMIRQKLPHRLYLGIQLSDTPGCRFNYVKSYESHQKGFIDLLPYEIIRYITNVEELISTLMEHMNISYGCEINIITEYPRGYGSSITSLIYTLLSVMLFIFEGKLPLETIQTGGFVYSHLFDDICLLACYIKYCIVGSAGVCSPFALLNLSIGPLLQIGSIDFGGISHDKILHNICNLSTLIYPSGNGGKRKIVLNSLTVNKNPLLPRDFAIIHVAKSHDSIRKQEIVLSQVSLQQWTDLLHDIIEKYDIDIDLNNILLSPKQVNGHVNTLLYARLIYAITQYLIPENQNIIEHDFFTVLQDMGWYHSFIERDYMMLTMLYSTFNQCKKHNNEVCAFIPITPTKTGGSFLVVLPRHSGRDTIEDMVSVLHSKQRIPLEIFYASRKEPLPSYGGLLVRQYISGGMYSDYVSKGMAQLIDGGGNKKIGLYDELLGDERLKQSILLDIIKRKVFVCGEKINHKILCSQSATIEIILYLFDHINEFVPNRSLPVSAYSRNKNEMISKIIMPLQDIMKEHCDESLEIICSGTLYDWTICLKKKPKSIFVITPINQ